MGKSTSQWRQVPRSHVKEEIHMRLRDFWPWLKQEFRWRFQGRIFEIKLTEEAQRQLDELPEEAQAEILKLMERIARNPYRGPRVETRRPRHDGDEEIQIYTTITTAEYDKLRKKADILEFLFGEKGVRTENLMKLQIWSEKADLWDQYAIYDNDKEEKIPVKNLIEAYEGLEAVKKLVAKGPLVNVDTLEECQLAVDDWLGKMMNVLEDALK